MVIKSQEMGAQPLRRELGELRGQIAALETADEHRPEYGLAWGDWTSSLWARYASIPSFNRQLD